MNRAFLPRNASAATLTSRYSASRAGGLTEAALLSQLTELALKLDALPGKKPLVLAAYRQLLVELEQHTYDVDSGDIDESPEKRPCAHESVITPDGHGAYCKFCGE